MLLSDATQCRAILDAHAYSVFYCNKNLSNANAVTRDQNLMFGDSLLYHLQNFVTSPCVLFQHIDQITRKRSHQEGSILDLIISKDKEHITNIEYGAHLGKSDHLALKVTVNELIYPVELEPRSKFQYHKGDYQGIRNQLGRVSWSSLFEGKGINECWSIFKAKILELQDEFIPTTLLGTRHKPHWMDRTLVLALKEKKNAWRKYVFCRSSENFEQYKFVRNRTKSIILDAQRNFERKIAREAKVNPKSFWNYVGKKVHPKSCTILLM